MPQSHRASSVAPPPPPPPANASPAPSHSHPRNCSHYIQFYSQEPSLYDSIGAFILPSFFSNEHAAVIVATKPHIDALEIYLRGQNLVPEMLKRREQLELLPAEEILEYLTPGGRVSADRFNGLFGPLFAKRQKRYPRLLVYGELVNILCERGEHEKAHELEQVWEVFLAGKEAALLCGYNLNAFSGDGLEDVFQRICQSHSHVSPVDSGVTTMLGRPEDQQMVLAMLQQKTLRLEVELGRRIAAERLLQDTLDHLGKRPTDGVMARERDGGRSMVSMPPTGICAATTVEGSIKLFLNRRFLDLSGLAEEVVKRNGEWLEAVHYQDRERVTHNLRLADGKARRTDYRFVHPNGRILWVSGESVSKSTGYVHTVVDISQFRPSQASASLPPEVPYGFASTSSGGGAVGGNWSGLDSGADSTASLSYPANLFIRGGYTRDCRLPQELINATQTLWDLIQSPSKSKSPSPPTQHPPSHFSGPYNSALHPPLLPPDNSIPVTNQWQVDARQAWRASLPPQFVPNNPAFQDVDGAQKATIRLLFIAHLVSLIFLTRPAMLSMAAPDPGGVRPPEQPQQPKPAGVDAKDPGRWASMCISSATEAIQIVQALMNENGGDPEAEEIARTARSSRLALNCFFVAAVTALLELSLPASASPLPEADRSRRKVDILTTISAILDSFVSLPGTTSLASQYATTLSPFLTPTTNTSSAASSTTATPAPPDAYPIEYFTQSIHALFSMPSCGAVFVGSIPYAPHFWTWRDLLLPPSHTPLGPEAKEVSREPAGMAMRQSSGAATPEFPIGRPGCGSTGVGTAYIVDFSAANASMAAGRSHEKRPRGTSPSGGSSCGSSPGNAKAKQRMSEGAEAWGMSRELEALFRRVA